MRNETYYEDRVEVNCTDTGVDVMADVIMFNPNSTLSVAVQGMKILLNYNAQHGVYIGSSAGLEFQSKGPKALN